MLVLPLIDIDRVGLALLLDTILVPRPALSMVFVSLVLSVNVEVVMGNEGVLPSARSLCSILVQESELLLEVITASSVVGDFSTFTLTAVVLSGWKWLFMVGVPSATSAVDSSFISSVAVVTVSDDKMPMLISVALSAFSAVIRILLTFSQLAVGAAVGNTSPLPARAVVVRGLAAPLPLPITLLIVHSSSAASYGEVAAFTFPPPIPSPPP